jgi:hypothetical protein
MELLPREFKNTKLNYEVVYIKISIYKVKKILSISIYNETMLCYIDNIRVITELIYKTRGD